MEVVFTGSQKDTREKWIDNNHLVILLTWNMQLSDSIKMI